MRTMSTGEPRAARPFRRTPNWLTWAVLATLLVGALPAADRALPTAALPSPGADHLRAASVSSTVLTGGALAVASKGPPATSVPLAGSGARWFNLTPRLNPSPEARYATTMTYDAKDGYIVLFGGETASGTGLADTWTYRNGNWTQLFPPTSPSARIAPVMVYDPVDQYVVLFGGIQTSNYVTVADTWTFAGGTWTNITNSIHPPDRAESSAAWDQADQSVILFGGVNVSGTIFSDTWRFVGGTWTQLFPASPPSPRAAGGMTYDAADGYLLMFGGVNASVNYSDTWRFTNGSWAEMFPAIAPVGRATWSMAYDPQLSEVVLFGGGTGDDMVLFGDTWSFHGGGWTQQFPTSTPSQRQFAQMAWDAADGYLVLATGVTDFAPMMVVPETWAYAAAPTVTLNGPTAPVDADQPVRWTTTVTGGVAPDAVSWQFGDGASATGPVAAHLYTAPGTYQVNVTVDDSFGQTATANQTLAIAPALTVALTVQPGTARVGVAFNLSVKSTGGSAPVSYSWTLGDGRTLSGAGPFVRNYTVPGPYDIVVIATDAAGISRSSSDNITVTAGATVPPSASSAGPVGWWPVALLVVVVLAVVATLVFVFRRRRGPGAPMTYATPPSGSPPPAPPPTMGGGSPPPGG